MTSAEAMQQAKDSMSDANLEYFKMPRSEWEECVEWLAHAYGIYPDLDPRNKKYELQTDNRHVVFGESQA